MIASLVIFKHGSDFLFGNDHFPDIVSPDEDDLEKRMLDALEELQCWIKPPMQRSKLYALDLLNNLKADIKTLAAR